MKLSIVIPAYNEEQAIASIVERCLDARSAITTDSYVDDVEIIVVSDGSTDRTAQIAAGFDDIKLIVFEQNRGYGAAIKHGFEESSGDLVGFLDADGTCDPNHFLALCESIVEDCADVAIGSRMGSDSRMPRLRRLGNRIYALILSSLSNQVVTDTASGMRVIRRDALPQLYPLPNGLHFTPAMSARVLMDDQLRITDRPMPYDERTGASKLNVLRDGVRFLHTILFMALMWRPGRLLGTTAIACFGVVVLLTMHPVETWIRLGSIKEDTIYRLLFCSFLGTVGVAIFSTGVICNHLHRLLRSQHRAPTFISEMIDRIYSPKGLACLTPVVLLISGWLVGEGLWTRITAGYVTIHWARVVLAGLVVFTFIQLCLSSITIQIIRFHSTRKTLQIAKSAKPIENTTKQMEKNSKQVSTCGTVLHNRAVMLGGQSARQ